MTEERGDDNQHLESFLANKLGNGESESGSFTLNREKAKQTLLDSLKLEPEGFCRHLLVAAYLGGATQFEFKIPRKVGGYRLARNHLLTFRFDGEPLLPEDVERIPNSLLEADERLRRFALAHHQAVALGAYWTRLSVRDVDRLTVLTVDRGKPQLRARTPKNTRIYRRETVFEVKFPRALFHLRKGRQMSLRLAGCREAFESSTSWSPFQSRLNKALLSREKPPEGALGFQRWSQANLAAWIEPLQSNTVLIPVWCGVTLKQIRLNPKEWGLPIVPGLRVVVITDDLKLDPTGLRPVQSSSFQKLAEKSLLKSHELLGALAQDRAVEARTYFLANWSRLQHLPLDSYALFKTRKAEYVTLQSLRERRLAREEILQKLEPDDAPYALRLLQVSHFYRFYRGDPAPDLETINPAADWVSLRRKEWLSFARLEDHTESHRCPLPQTTETYSWHPHQPWYAFQSENSIIVWDLKLERVWHRRKGCYQHFEFSTYGRYLYLFEKVAPNRVRFSLLLADDFGKGAVSTQVPGKNPMVVDSLLLLWLNPLCFQVLRLPELSERIETFSTPEPLTTLLDRSPCGRFALLSGPSSSYLFKPECLTLEKLPLKLEKGLFSWHSDYVFGETRGHKLALHLATLSITWLPPTTFHLTRSGRAIEQWSQIPTPTTPLAPGLRLFNAVRLKSRNLLYPPQSSRGRRTKDVEFCRTSGPNFSYTVLLSGQEPVKAWRGHGGSEAGLFGGFHGFSHYLWASTPSGVRFQSLENSGSPELYFDTVFVFKEHLCRVQGPNVLFFRGFSQTHVVFSIHSSDLDKVAILGNDISFFNEGQWQVADRSLGFSLYRGEFQVTGRNGDWQVSSPPDQAPLVAHADKPDRWISAEEYESLRLHPWKNLALAEKEGFTTLLRLRQTGPAPVDNTRREGTFGEFSADGEHYYLLHDEHVNIHTVVGGNRVKSLPLPTSDTKPRWLSPCFLQVGRQVWWRGAEADWSSCRLTKWEFPPNLASVPGTCLALVPNGAEYQFLNLTNGQVVATYRPLAEHWFLFTPDGRWDGSTDCLKYLRPWPNKPPRRGLLRSLRHDYQH